MIETKAVLAVDIRKHAGGFTEEEISTKRIEDLIDRGVFEFFRVRPRIIYRAVPLVKGQDAYPVPSDVWHIEDVIFNQDASQVPSVLGYGQGSWGFMSGVPTLFPMSTGTGGEFRTSSGFDSTSLITLWYQKLEAMYEKFGYDWYYREGVIYIQPTPVDSGYLLYKAHLQGDLAFIPQFWKEVFVHFVVGFVCEEVGASRMANRVTSIPNPGGSISFDNGQALMNRGEKLQKEFYEQTGANASSFLIG